MLLPCQAWETSLNNLKLIYNWIKIADELPLLEGRSSALRFYDFAHSWLTTARNVNDALKNLDCLINVRLVMNFREALIAELRNNKLQAEAITCYYVIPRKLKQYNWFKVKSYPNQ